MPVHQFLPTLSPGDAIGNHVLRIRPLLEALGPSTIYVERCDPSLSSQAKDYREFLPESAAAILYHASIGTPMARRLLALRTSILLDYHNVTPTRFYAPYEPQVAALLYSGRAECRDLARRSPLGIADSDYSARELDEMGCRATATIPILIDFARYEEQPHGPLLEELLGSKHGIDILFVGRVSPNKRQEDVIKAFTVYKRQYDSQARLFLVGQSSSDRYRRTLEAFISRLGVGGIRVCGGVPDSHLWAYYRAADVFVSMSEHEGFCVPLLEAMTFCVPIIAFGGGAVPETLADAGILLRHKRYEQIAALIHLVATDADVRSRLIEAGRVRLQHFRPERHEPRLLRLIESVIEPDGGAGRPAADR